MRRRTRTRRGGRRELPWPVKLGMGLGVATLALVLGESGAQMAGMATAYQPDRIGGWRMMPAQEDAIVPTHEGASFRMSTNADGLRTTLPRARTPGVRRVAILGDSIAFGWGASDGGTLADGMMQRLAELGITDIEVLNAAQPGYSTSQVARVFDQLVCLYQPDLAIVFLPMHDHNLVVVSDREHLKGAASPVAAARVWLATRSSLYEVLRRALFPFADQAFVVSRSDDSTTREPRVPRVSEAERAQNMAEISARLSEWGGRLALGHIPFEGDLVSPRPMRRLGEDWTADYAHKHDIPIVDLRPCCGPDEGHLVFEHDKGHLTPEGNRRAGYYAADQVIELLSE